MDLLTDEREMLVEREFQSPNDESDRDELEPVVSWNVSSSHQTTSVTETNLNLWCRCRGAGPSSHRAHRVTLVDKQFLDQTIHITVSQSS